ncbi:hypothetical protein MAR_024388 [Mya arenaria]|uniref:Uncharacterized protein n=1 Tax=Mya arenaria TaxID=6604 RepID=A0ABY7DUL3_MYAAR|nr:hypothetical protein MAR_024388 [Mya arenaria]
MTVLYMAESMLAQATAALSCLVLPSDRDDVTGDVSDVADSLSSDSSLAWIDQAVDCTCKIHDKCNDMNL